LRFSAVGAPGRGVITVGKIDSSQPGIAKFVVAGLVSGFSEPFDLGLLDKVAALAGGGSE